MSQCLASALHLLVQLGRGPADLDQLAESTGVHKTTVLRLLRTLADERFVFRDNSHHYHLGSRIFELAARAPDQREVRRIAAPHLAAFNREYGRTTHLAAMEGGDVVYIDKLESHDRIRMYSRIGLRANLQFLRGRQGAPRPTCRMRNCGPLSDSMDFSARTANTITDAVERYLAEMPHGPGAGLGARPGGERAVRSTASAAPVRGASGRVVAAVSVSVPDVVLTYERSSTCSPPARHGGADLPRLRIPRPALRSPSSEE